MSPVAVSADRRFHRAHVKPSRRRSAWRAAIAPTLKYGLAATLLVLAGLKAARFASTSPLLRIDQIATSGNQRMSSEAVRATLDGLRGENILFADLDQWRATLLESPWVRDATLRRFLPSTIEVNVQERSPIAIGRLGNRLYLVDDRGATIDEYGPQYGRLDLPIVDGLSNDGGRAIDARRAALAARVIVELRQKPAVANRLSQVDVSDPRNATLLLSDDGAQLRVGDSHFLERVESYLTLADTLHQRMPAIDYVDLRFDGRVYARPAGKMVKTVAATGEQPVVSRVTDAQQR